MTLIENRVEQNKIEKYGKNLVDSNIVNLDLSTVKVELFTNPRRYIQDLLKSLKVKIGPPFPAYKVDLSLFYLKQVYERVFPQKRHGAQLVADLNKTNLKRIRDETDQVTESVTFRNGVSLGDRSIITNLLEGVKIQGQLPSFVKAISIRSNLSRTTVQRRIRVGKYLARSRNASNILLNYRKGVISHSKVLTEVKKLDKKTIC